MTNQRTTRQRTPTTRGWLPLAAAAGVAAAAFLTIRRTGACGTRDATDATGREQAITVRASLERVESGWQEWCQSGQSRLPRHYTVRFEPAPGARGTEVRLAGGGWKSTVREELRRFKQQIETGEIAVSDGPGLWRPAQPRPHSSPVSGTEVRR